MKPTKNITLYKRSKTINIAEVYHTRLMKPTKNNALAYFRKYCIMFKIN